MRLSNVNRIALVTLLACRLVHPADAEVLAYTNFSQWQSAGGPFTTITFAEFQPGPPLTTEFAPQGLIFTDGHTSIAWGQYEGFPADGAGALGFGGAFGGNSHLSFTQPMTSLGGSFPSGAIFDLYSQGSLIYSSTESYALFFGLVSTQAFDAAVIRQPKGDPFVSMDTLYFGPPVPAPGAALSLLALGLLSRIRRNR